MIKRSRIGKPSSISLSLSVTLLFVVVVLGDDIPASRPVNSVFCNGDQHRHHQQKRQTFYLPLPSSKMMNQVEQKSPVSDWRCHTMIISITGWWIWMDRPVRSHYKSWCCIAPLSFFFGFAFFQDKRLRSDMARFQMPSARLYCLIRSALQRIIRCIFPNNLLVSARALLDVDPQTTVSTLDTVLYPGAFFSEGHKEFVQRIQPIIYNQVVKQQQHKKKKKKWEIKKN